MDKQGQMPGHVPLVVATRGDTVESVHYGSIAVVTAAGEVVSAIGDMDFPIFTRSTLKPFQALPFVLAGGPARFGFSEEQVALLCASHSGEPRHVAGVADMLARIGCDEAQLQCGSHLPLFYAATGVSPPSDLIPGPLQHNCSGKHAGFLAWCRLHGQPTENYLDPGHPLQQAILHGLAELAECSDTDIRSGVDGCSAPNHALALVHLARLYARLATAAEGGGQARALATLFRAMTTHPEMVSGTGRGDLVLMGAGAGGWVAKVGAEGVQAMGIRSRQLGIAIKIADGGARALPVAVGAVLEQLGLLPAGGNEAVRRWRDGEVRNHAGRLTGQVVPVFRLG